MNHLAVLSGSHVKIITFYTYFVTLTYSYISIGVAVGGLWNWLTHRLQHYKK
jgi:hypothetical protein